MTTQQTNQGMPIAGPQRHQGSVLIAGKGEDSGNVLRCVLERLRALYGVAWRDTDARKADAQGEMIPRHRYYYGLGKVTGIDAALKVVEEIVKEQELASCNR